MDGVPTITHFELLDFIQPRQGDEDDPETGVQSSFRVERPVPPRALTLFQLKEMFPFVGTFHFRLKVGGDHRIEVIGETGRDEVAYTLGRNDGISLLMLGTICTTKLLEKFVTPFFVFRSHSV